MRLFRGRGAGDPQAQTHGDCLTFTCATSGSPALDLLPHVPGDRNHGVSCRTGGRSSTRSGLPAMQSPKTTKLYDRPADTITVDEIERIVI